MRKEFYVSAGVLIIALNPCLQAVAAGEVNEFMQPSDFACITRPAQPDFGPPAGCGDGSQPHNRTVLATSLSTANGTVTMTNATVVVFDAEDVQIVQHDGQLPQRGRTIPRV